MPPCISQLEGGLVQVAIEVEDRAQRSAIISKFSAEWTIFCVRHASLYWQIWECAEIFRVLLVAQKHECIHL